MKVLICDATEQSAVDQIEAAGIEVDNRPDVTPEQLMQILRDYDGMVVRSRTKVRAALIDAAPGLKVIVRGGVGLDNIDVQYARSKAITVLNTPAASSDSVAELTIGYLFALARSIPQMTASMKAGKWEKKAFTGSEIAGKVLGIVGLGRIGLATARRARALGMDVIYYRRQRQPEIEAELGIEYAALDELFSRSDYISLHVPATAETRNLLNSAAIEKMKPGVFVINCGRGGTVDEDALYDGIVAGKVAGAALDVFADEPSTGHKLFELKQVLGSPHVGAATREAQERVGGEVADLLIQFSRR
jgi:D-3-phosphoglycerate dehydrogenase